MPKYIAYKTIATMTVLALSACATVTDLRQGQPERFTSGKNAQQLTGCVYDSLVRKADTSIYGSLIGVPRQTITEGGYSIVLEVIMAISPDIVGVIDLKESAPSGGVVSLYTRSMASEKFREPIRQRIRDCL